MTASDDGLPGWSCFHPRMCVPSHLETFSYSGAEFTKQRSCLEPLLWTWGVGSNTVCIRGVHLASVGDDKRFNWPFGSPCWASCCVLDLFPCKRPQCSTAVERKPAPFVWPPPPCSCCFCASALLSVGFVRLGLSLVLSLSLTSGLSKWDFLLGSTLFSCKVNLFTASVNSACSWMLFVSACFSLIL